MSTRAVLPPPYSQSRWSDRHLCEHVRTRGTPLYVYDFDVLLRRVAEMRKALNDCGGELYFATMANDRPQVLSKLAAEGVGACVNSLPHLELALRAGFDASRVQFTSTGIPEGDMKALQLRKIRTNLDSISQLERWIGQGHSTVGIRVNAYSLGHRHVRDRIGIGAGDVSAAVERARSLGGKVNGLHVYVGTNFTHPQEMLPTLGAFFELGANTLGIDYLNIGGGVGVDYAQTGKPFDLSVFGRELARIAMRARGRSSHDLRVIFEPGRSLVAGCGLFVTRVTDIKRLNGETFVVVDGSVAVFPRPLLHPESPHHVRVVNAESRHFEPPMECSVVGRTTYSSDILARTTLPTTLAIGDLLAFSDAGAYSESMASRFLGQPEPQVVVT